MSAEPQSWRWVPGDDKDPAERWKLMEGDRVVLECGQVDAIDQGTILAGRDALDALEALLEAETFADAEGWVSISSPGTEAGEAAVALARAALRKAGREVPS